jgi:hypothetical protein
VSSERTVATADGSVGGAPAGVEADGVLAGAPVEEAAGGALLEPELQPASMSSRSAGSNRTRRREGMM